VLDSAVGDGFGAGGGGHGGGDIADPVGNAIAGASVMLMIALDLDEAWLDMLHGPKAVIRQLHKALERAPVVDPGAKAGASCMAGPSMPGWDTWGHSEGPCDELPVKAGLCGRHYKRRWNWAKSGSVEPSRS
jgi:hypothetical protein